MPTPKPGRVCHLPHEVEIPEDSVAHCQKKQHGFFNHPVLVVGTDERYTQFYSLTRNLPKSIRDLNMYFRLGEDAEDEGEDVLRLANETSPMCHTTFVNLEQRFQIETPYLRTWFPHVQIAADQLQKIDARIEEIEAQQNRFIYKPLPRDLSRVPPGTVLMLPNAPGSGTFGAPVLVIGNNYPYMRFCRVKLVADNEALRQSSVDWLPCRQRSLLIGREGSKGHDGTPIMLIKYGPDMREPSYVELVGGIKQGSLAVCKTWCWPPIVMREESIAALRAWCAWVESGAASSWYSRMGYGWSTFRGSKDTMVRMRDYPRPIPAANVKAGHGLIPSGHALNYNSGNRHAHEAQWFPQLQNRVEHQRYLNQAQRVQYRPQGPLGYHTQTDYNRAYGYVYDRQRYFQATWGKASNASSEEISGEPASNEGQVKKLH